MKKKFENFTLNGETDAAAQAWAGFKQVRNQINNRKKFEEKIYKAEIIAKTIDSPAQTWRKAKTFMNWGQTGGPPSQLNIGGQLVTKAALIAQEMNKFFIEKIRIIRSNIPFLANSFSKCKELMQGKNCHLSFIRIYFRTTG